MERLNNVQGASNLIEEFTDKKTVFRSHDMSICLWDSTVRCIENMATIF